MTTFAVNPDGARATHLAIPAMCPSCGGDTRIVTRSARRLEARAVLACLDCRHEFLVLVQLMALSTAPPKAGDFLAEAMA